MTHIEFPFSPDQSFDQEYFVAPSTPAWSVAFTIKILTWAAAVRLTSEWSCDVATGAVQYEVDGAGEQDGRRTLPLASFSFLSVSFSSSEDDEIMESCFQGKPRSGEHHFLSNSAYNLGGDA